MGKVEEGNVRRQSTVLARATTGKVKCKEEVSAMRGARTEKW